MCCNKKKTTVKYLGIYIAGQNDTIFKDNSKIVWLKIKGISEDGPN